jgi:hypothetical protein
VEDSLGREILGKNSFERTDFSIISKNMPKVKEKMRLSDNSVDIFRELR